MIILTNNRCKDFVFRRRNLTNSFSSPIYGHPTSFPELLGGLETDERGKIVSAKALLSVWLTHVNFSQVNMDETGNVAGTGDWVQTLTIDFFLTDVNQILINSIRLRLVPQLWPGKKVS